MSEERSRKRKEEGYFAVVKWHDNDSREVLSQREITLINEEFAEFRREVDMRLPDLLVPAGWEYIRILLDDILADRKEENERREGK